MYDLMFYMINLCDMYFIYCKMFLYVIYILRVLA